MPIEHGIVFERDYRDFHRAVTALRDSARKEGVGAVKLDYELLKHSLSLGLRLVDPKQPYGTELFNALARLTITIADEAVCLRLNDKNEIEVLLTQRSATESAYPGEWHCPGSAQRPGESHDDVFGRLTKGEFWASVTSREFVEDFDNPNEARGHFEEKVFVCEVAEGTKGTWFPVSALPEKTVAHHSDHIIPIAVKAFRARHGLD